MSRPPSPRRVFFDHTGDVGVTVTAPTLPALFREAALAFTETLTDAGAVSAPAVEEVTLKAPTLDDLMVEWLNELLYRFEVRNLLPVDAEPSVTESGDTWYLTARVASEDFDAERHSIKVLVKGVTYHQLDVRQSDEGWETSVVFDI